jgi:hypothetical protein
VSAFATGTQAVAALTLDASYDAVLTNLGATQFNGMDLYWTVSICWPELSRKFVFAVDKLQPVHGSLSEARLPILSRPYGRFELVSALLRAVVPQRTPPRRKSVANPAREAATPSKVGTPNTNVGPYRCASCQKPSPLTETEYSLIGSRHGWRVSTRPTPEGRRVLDWCCAECWTKRKLKDLHP